jgi:steroid 5-alpha reductase family enzyme
MPIRKVGNSFMLKNSSTQSVTGVFWKENRTFGFFFIALSYFFALMVGWIVYNSAGLTIWLNLLLADLAATIVIWVCSLILNNASVYDPYWSVQPMVIIPLLVFQEKVFDVVSLLLCALLILWGFRLTANWAATFRGLHVQDWRYDLIKNKTGFLYPIVNLLGIQLMPTLVVFACMAPVVFLVLHVPDRPLLVLPGLLVSLLGFIIEAAADYQLRRFHTKNPDKSVIIREGLWTYSRHPNYLGEIFVWWGMYLACLLVYPSAWQLGLGALLNTALFLFISIPMAEKKLLEYKEGYLDLREQTRMLLPLPKKPRETIYPQ